MNQIFIFPESVYETARAIADFEGTDKAFKFLDAICQYGLFGKEPDKDDPIQIYFVISKAALDTKKNNILKNTNCGKPRLDIDMATILTLREQGYTQQQIADELNISVSTVNRRLMAHKKQKNQ